MHASVTPSFTSFTSLTALASRPTCLRLYIKVFNLQAEFLEDSGKNLVIIIGWCQLWNCEVNLLVHLPKVVTDQCPDEKLCYLLRITTKSTTAPSTKDKRVHLRLGESGCYEDGLDSVVNKLRLRNFIR